jgi:hypothetical protein
LSPWLAWRRVKCRSRYGSLKIEEGRVDDDGDDD